MSAAGTLRTQSAARLRLALYLTPVALFALATCARPVAPTGLLKAPLDTGDPAALRAAASAALRALRSPARGTSAADQHAVRSLGALLDLLDACGTDGGARARIDRAVAGAFAASPALPVLVTGYHEPVLRARTARSDEFRFPIYGVPREARSGRQVEQASDGSGASALPTRAAIDAGALAGRHLELLWSDDPVELFFLHVQGSGRLRLEDGRTVRIGYAASNGQAYRSIGAVLAERGVFRPSEATAPAIKAYLRAHPDEAGAIMAENPRYVFFRIVDTPLDEGPAGSLGAPLTALRSVAVDPAVTPLGSLGQLVVPLPDGTSLMGLVVAMDSGAAIKGPGRIDLFVGSGDRAADIAGELRARGEIRWLQPVPTAAGQMAVSASGCTGGGRTLGAARVLNPSTRQRSAPGRLEGES